MLSPLKSLDLWQRTVCESVRREGPDLSARQMAVLLTIYRTESPHTVRALAKELHVSKPAVTRALDRLEKLELIRRKTDEHDRRSVLLQRTVKGSVFLSEFGELVAESAASVATG